MKKTFWIKEKNYNLKKKSTKEESLSDSICKGKEFYSTYAGLQKNP